MPHDNKTVPGHLDEGVLHAYLDGEVPSAGDVDAVTLAQVEWHLAACDACRSRLEEARRVRDRAAAILSESGPPETAVPPFDVVRQQAGLPPERGRWSGSPMRALAAAAVVILAVTVGWEARGVFRGGSEDSKQAAAVPGADTAPLSGALAKAEAGDDQPGPAPGVRAPSDEQTALGAGRQPEATRETQERLDSGTATNAPVAPPTVTAEQPTVAGDTAARNVAPPVDELRRVAQAAPPVSLTDTLAPTLRRDSQAAPAEARAAVLPGATVVTGTDTVLPRAAAAAPQPAPGGAVSSADAATWLTTSRGGAAGSLGRTPVEVPQLEVLGYATGSVNGVTAVRVIQQLDPGRTVELIEWLGRPENESAMLAAFPLTARRGDLTVAVRGALPADSLRMLLARIPYPEP